MSGDNGLLKGFRSVQLTESNETPGFILLVGDLHYKNHKNMSVENDTGVYSRLKDPSRALKALCETVACAYGESVFTDIFILGDVIHDFGVLQPEVLDEVRQTFRYLTDTFNVDITVFSGNHDINQTGRSCVPAFMDSRVNIITEPTVVNFYKDKVSLDFVFLPYDPDKSRFIKNLDNVKKSVSTNSRFHKTVVFTHHHFEGAVTGPLERTFGEGLEIPSSLLIFSGHIHKHQELFSAPKVKDLGSGEVVYVGSPLQHHFGEGMYTPGGVVLDVTQALRSNEVSISHKFWETPITGSVKFLTLDCRDKSSEDIFEEMDISDEKNWESKLGKVYWRLLVLETMDVSSLARGLDKAGISYIFKTIPADVDTRSRVSRIVSKIKSEEDENTILGDSSEEESEEQEFTLDDMVMAFSVMKIPDKQEAQRMRNVGKNILKNAGWSKDQVGASDE